MSDAETRPLTHLSGVLSRAYLLVIEGGSSHAVPLPPQGTLLVGRAQEAGLRLADDSVSRRHAEIRVAGGEVEVVDLGSQNGTRVNGERITGSQAVAPGDVIGIGEVTVVLHGARHTRRSALLDPQAFRARLGEEVERAQRYERPLGVVAVAFDSATDASELALAIAEGLGLIDVLGRGSDTLLYAALPEHDAASVEETAAALAARARKARIGAATCPDDAADADSLLAAARDAAHAAAAGSAAMARDLAHEIQVGDRTIVAADATMHRLFGLIRRLAASDIPVLISGETGSGKENAAYAVHCWSRRASGPFVALNCAAITESLVESELFGHEAGAFSGATQTKLGLLESAAGGTVFLDELGELSAAVQAKLLRALEARRIMRVGDVREREIDIRIVAATHKDLEAEVARGAFRKDLFFRLSTAVVVLPPLRERPREIPILARRFLSGAAERLGRRGLELGPATLRCLAEHAWPGNVRELKNAMDFAAAAVEGETVEPWHLPARISGRGEPAKEAAEQASPGGFRPLADELRELERRRMVEALEAAGGVQTRAAELISMPLRTFVLRMKQHGIRAKRP